MKIVIVDLIAIDRDTWLARRLTTSFSRPNATDRRAEAMRAGTARIQTDVCTS